MVNRKLASRVLVLPATVATWRNCQPLIPLQHGTIAGPWVVDPGPLVALMISSLTASSPKRLRVGSFNGKLRHQVLNGEVFDMLREAQLLIEAWRKRHTSAWIAGLETAGALTIVTPARPAKSVSNLATEAACARTLRRWGADTLLWLFAALDNRLHLRSNYPLKASAVAKSLSYGR